MIFFVPANLAVLNLRIKAYFLGQRSQAYILVAAVSKETSIALEGWIATENFISLKWDLL